MCHIILVLPILAVGLFFYFRLSTALPLYLLICAASVFVYVKVMGAMKRKVQTGLEEMLGERATVIEDINPEGKIIFNDETWKATTQGQALRKGAKVRITGSNGLTLIVELFDPRGDEIPKWENS